MSKHHVLKPIKHDGEVIAEGIIELDDKHAVPMHASGHLKRADDDAVVTPTKKASAKKAEK